MMPAVPEFAEFQAPQQWDTVELISDLHLSESETATFDMWQRYMHTTTADAVFILGDLFDVWVGDDCIREDLSRQSPSLNFEERCALVLQAASKRLKVFFMHGNRDFLIAAHLTTVCNATLLADPTVLTFKENRYLLTHGDMLCVADTQYLAFRNIVRQSDWQLTQLAKPLAEREVIGKQMRAESKNTQANLLEYADVDNAVAVTWLEASNSKTMIHGHTHKPATHDLGSSLKRIVMTDWDMKDVPNRAEALQLSKRGLHRVKLS